MNVPSIPKDPNEFGQCLDTTIYGKCSWFGGPDDTGVREYETLSLYHYQLARDLNPEAMYCAIRFTRFPGVLFKRSHWKDNICVRVVNPKNDKFIVARIVDWGPAERTGRIIDLSPGAMKALGAETDNILGIKLVLALEQAEFQKALKAGKVSYPEPEPPALFLSEAEFYKKRNTNEE